jgi:DNA (cytosine-5)-methyltransferase 1
VFVVGCLGDWRPTAEVLFESESLRRDIKKGKSKGKDIAGYVKSGFGQYREDAIAGTLRASGGDLSGGSETFVTNDTVGTLLARDYKGVDSYNTDKMIVQKVYENHPSDSRVKEMGKTCQTVTSTWGSGGGNIPFVQNIAYEWHNQDSRIKPIQVAATLNCNAGGREGHLVQSIGFTQCDAARDVGQNISPTLRSGGDGGYPAHSVATNMAVRRLTPVECERLQGFPDNYTNIKENCPDGARYKALGNSMAVPVMRWIGERINSYETMRSSAVVQVETGVGLAKV